MRRGILPRCKCCLACALVSCKLKPNPSESDWRRVQLLTLGRGEHTLGGLRFSGVGSAWVPHDSSARLRRADAKAFVLRHETLGSRVGCRWAPYGFRMGSSARLSRRFKSYNTERLVPARAYVVNLNWKHSGQHVSSSRFTTQGRAI